MNVDFTDEEMRILMKLLAGEIRIRDSMGQPTTVEIGISQKLHAAKKAGEVPFFVDPKYIKPGSLK